MIGQPDGEVAESRYASLLKFRTDVARSTFKIATTATNLNGHGATVHWQRDLPVESVIVMKNSRGTRTCARIVVQRRVRNVYAYGLEFLEPDKAKNF